MKRRAAPDRSKLPMPFPPFGGKIGTTYKTGEIEKVDILLGDTGLSEDEERQMQERFHAGVNY